MNQGFRQRIVGALVLLALTVILAPVLFDFSHRPLVDQTSQIPPAPSIEPVVFAEPQRPTDIPERDERELFWPEEPTAAADGTAGSAASEPVAVPDGFLYEGSLAADGSSSADGSSLETSQSGESTADAWVIQVGSFGERTGAEALLQRLIDDGYKAYRRAQQRNGRELHLIFVGPVLSRTEADRQQTAIEDQYDLQVLVRRFTP